MITRVPFDDVGQLARRKARLFDGLGDPIDIESDDAFVVMFNLTAEWELNVLVDEHDKLRGYELQYRKTEHRLILPV
ncbi:hypothetical protein [Rubinisphaera margarita]|uniref:hypothetical protein n=1 Tax=Rubinisphaera margarita TaxID=2909586 RepID=UPI001EE8CF1C|nr:hypothetical protein [Rubinisphaera margarita]MCG6154663.1 hypothetical protein [Rubinisphaera margarita]